jgi:antibiotic biosynthesis monooxygenase (ABM) superfamily enzyme
MKSLWLSLLSFGAVVLAPASAFAETQPTTLVHVVTVKWKKQATPEQIQAALDGVKALPGKYPGIVHVWTKSIKVQGGKANAFVMEFADQASFKAYADSPAQKDWYKVYLPIRDESTTFDIIN